MKKYKEGTQFIVCGVKYLVDVLGWHVDDKNYYHSLWPDLSISPNMMKLHGETLTIRKSCFRDYEYGSDWYGVKENTYYWPVASFLGLSHTCEEGMTPLGGWFICKICGDNLREIIK